MRADGGTMIRPGNRSPVVKTSSSSSAGHPCGQGSLDKILPIGKEHAVAENSSPLDAIVADLKVEIQLRPESAQRSFQTFDEMSTFFAEEYKFWSNSGIGELQSTFGNIVHQLRQATTGSPESSATRNSIAEAKRLASIEPIIYSSTKWAQFLKQLKDKGMNSAAAFAYFRGDYASNWNNNKRWFSAVIASVLFEQPGLISAGAEAEAAADAEQRTAITTFREDVNNRFQTLKRDIYDWKNSAQTDVSGLLTQNREQFAAEHKAQKDTWDASFKGWSQKVRALEDTYREQLRLKKPAEYWKELEERYVKQGRWWIAGAAAIVVALASWMSELVYVPPAMINGDKFTLGGLRGTILIAVGISACLYLLNLFAKVATSCYHLARDARERYQLTHVFLALMEDRDIEAKDREIVLSALFSRSDTGLLKGDSSPTLPTPLGSIIESLTKGGR